MGKLKKPQCVKLVIGMLSKDKGLFDTIEERLIKQFGEIDYRSELLPFNYTDYYNEELGYPLKRRFISFKRLIPPNSIAKIKVITNSLEGKFSTGKNGLSNRRVNLDPGYISDSKFILVTTKDYSHRLYLDKGIYGEVTLAWRNKGFEPYEWTYPDYRTVEYMGILREIRNKYMGLFNPKSETLNKT